MRIKTFAGDFEFFLDKLKNNENFAFSRFSDGELYIMQNKELKIVNDHVRIGERVLPKGFSEQDHKHFNPNQHQKTRKLLIDSFKYKDEGYYKGISCRCCVGDASCDWMINLHGGDDDSLTWSNLWINSNYPQFIERVVPEIIKQEVIFVCNEHADLTDTGFNVIRDYRCGSNCIVNDLGLADKIVSDVLAYDIKNKIFLFAASSLSNILIHKLWMTSKENTYIDIGTSLNHYIKMSMDRDYLKGYWLDKRAFGFGAKTCIW